MTTLTFTHRGSNYELTAQKAPQDTNGNARIDIITLKDGETFRPTIAGFRKIKIGYRVQAGAHGYSDETALQDLKAQLIALEPEETPQLAATEPRNSNTKEVRTMIREHIIENLSDDEANNLQEQLENVVKGFLHWYNGYERRKTPNVQDAFGEWLQGIPSELYATPYYEEQRELMTQWLGATDKKYTDTVVSYRYYAFLFREFNKLCALNNVEGIYFRL